jgi:hypothetical protein
VDDEPTKFQLAAQKMAQNIASSALSGPLKHDSVPFTPSAASLLRQFTPVISTAAERRDDERSSSSGGAVDAAVERRKAQLAQDFAQLLHKDGGASSYLSFAQQLRQRALRQRGAGEDGDTEAAGDGAREAKDGSAVDRDGRGGSGEGEEESAEEGQWRGEAQLADQENDPASFPPTVRWLVESAMAKAKTLAEQYNLLSYARESAKVDLETLGAQEVGAKKALEQLKGKEDVLSRKRYERTKRLLVAIRKDRRAAQKLLEELDSVLGTMKKRSGERIKDGYNLIPKARFVVSSMGLDNLVSGPDLASNYRDEVLCMVNPSQFFESYIVRHGTLGFRQYFEIILRLLGDDMKSANPSRGIGQLKAIRDALFYAEISYQIYESVGAAHQKLQRMRKLNLQEEGSYVAKTMLIKHLDHSLEVSVARGSESPLPVATIPVSFQTDHFAALTELFDEHLVDQFIMPDCDSGERRKLRFDIQRRYGIPLRRTVPESWKNAPQSPPLEAQLAAVQEKAPPPEPRPPQAEHAPATLHAPSVKLEMAQAAAREALEKVDESYWRRR